MVPNQEKGLLSVSGVDRVKRRFTNWGYKFSPWLLILVVLGTIIWLSSARFQGYNTNSFDLGTMSQAVWSATQGKPLIYSNAGVPISRLAIHVEIFYFLLAPIYALWPSPVTLLIIQAILFVGGAVPVYRLASRRMKGFASWLMVAIYLFYPVAQTAVLFEFHGDTLAMPLLLFALDALDRRAVYAYGIWLFLALSCKFYVAVPVMALGFILWLKGDRRWGAATFLTGFVWVAVVFGLIRPLYANVDIADPKVSASGYVQFYFGHFLRIGSTVPIRLTNGLIVLLPAILIGRRAVRWLLVACSIIIPVLISSGPGPSFSYRYHHYALAVPFLMMGIIDGAAQLQLRQVRLSKNRQLPWQTAVLMTLFIVLALNAVTVDGPLSPFFYDPLPGSAQGLTTSGYRLTSRDPFKDDWLAQMVPSDAAVAANRLLALRLVNREMLYLNKSLYKPLEKLLPELDYVAVDALYDFALGSDKHVSEGVATDYETIQMLLQNPEWQLQEAQDGLLLFGKRGVALRQQAEIVSLASDLPLLAQFDDVIGLVNIAIEPQDGYRYQIQLEWMALRPLTDQSPLIAVSRPDGLKHTRIVHLPTLALRPTTQWPSNQTVRETFEFTLPDETLPGKYPLYVGWYDTGNLFAAETDARSRVGEEFLIGWLTVP